MGYRPTGRAAGRPRGPASPDGKLRRARKNLPDAEGFTDLWRAVERVMHIPDKVVVRAPTADKRKVTVLHRYTRQERGQIMAFAWWVYANRSTWDRTALQSAVTILSPLMMFSSAFLAEMSGIPQSTTARYMIKPPAAPVYKVTGTCDMWVVHQLIEAAAKDLEEYREKVRELSITRDVPAAMMARLSGVPVEVLLRPDRGIQFYPERPDHEIGIICTQEQCDLYWRYHEEERNDYDPDPGDQLAARDALAGAPLGTVCTTTAPIPGQGELPYHFAIPGLPSFRDSSTDPHRFFKLVREWEFTYHFPAAAFVGAGASSEHARNIHCRNVPRGAGGRQRATELR